MSSAAQTRFLLVRDLLASQWEALQEEAERLEVCAGNLQAILDVVGS